MLSSWGYRRWRDRSQPRITPFLQPGERIEFVLAGSRMAYSGVMALAVGAAALLRVFDVATWLWAGLALQLVLIAFVIGVVAARVVCLTDRRLLVFRVGLGGAPTSLEHAVPRGTVSVQRTTARRETWPRLSLTFGGVPYQLSIAKGSSDYLPAFLSAIGDASRSPADPPARPD